MRQILTGYSIPSVWHQGGKICKWALCNFGPRSWIAAPPTLPCDGRSSLCQHNLQSESNTGRSVEAQTKRSHVPAHKCLFFRSHRNALWIPRLASRPPLPRHLLIWQEVKGRRDVNDTFASSAASVLAALAASPLKHRRVRCLSRRACWRKNTTDSSASHFSSRGPPGWAFTGPSLQSASKVTLLMVPYSFPSPLLLSSLTPAPPCLSLSPHLYSSSLSRSSQTDRLLPPLR